MLTTFALLFNPDAILDPSVVRFVTDPVFTGSGGMVQQLLTLALSAAYVRRNGIVGIGGTIVDSLDTVSRKR